jgi:hypothetical protein
VRLLGACSQEEHHVWVTDDLHDCALVLELFQFVLLYDLPLYFLDGYSGIFPPASVDQPVTSFRDLPIEYQVSMSDLVVS